MAANANRLSWDEYFAKIVSVTAERSPCERLQVGCLLVKDNRIISQGYNGFLPGCPHTSIVRNNHNKIVGVISDGDIRRAMKKNEKNFITLYAKDIMTIEPKTIMYDKKLTEVSRIMNKYKINSLIVINEQRNCVGVVQFYDLEI